MKTEVLEHLSSKVKIKLGLKQTEIGSLPEDWVVVELGNLIAKNPDYGINAPAVDFDFNLPNQPDTRMDNNSSTKNTKSHRS